jgi:hypothetical protein
MGCYTPADCSNGILFAFSREILYVIGQVNWPIKMFEKSTAMTILHIN